MKREGKRATEYKERENARERTEKMKERVGRERNRERKGGRYMDRGNEKKEVQ